MGRFSKRSLEGEYLIDHRASPGLTPDEVGDFNAPTVGKGDVFESPCVTCGHCRALIVLNPNRSRPREYCGKCDKYLCDECNFVRLQTGACQDFERRLDERQRLIERGQPNLALQLLLDKKGQ